MQMRLLIAGLIVGCAATQAAAQDPDAGQIEAAVNEGVGTGLGSCYAVADVQIIRGGATRQGDSLYLCDALLVWSISRTELIAFWEEPSRMESPEFAELVDVIGAQRLKAIVIEPGGFSRGDAAGRIRFRVRLELAGDDWIVTEFKSSKRSTKTDN